MKLTLIAALALFALPSVVFAQQDEGAIRQASQNLFVRGHVNLPVKYSVTGRLTDELTVFMPNGTRFIGPLTLQALRRSPFCESSFRNSNGNWTLRFATPGSPAFNGGRVALRRPGFGPIDVDGFIIR